MTFITYINTFSCIQINYRIVNNRSTLGKYASVNCLGVLNIHFWARKLGRVMPQQMIDQLSEIALMPGRRNEIRVMYNEYNIIICMKLKVFYALLSIKM